MQSTNTNGTQPHRSSLSSLAPTEVTVTTSVAGNRRVTPRRARRPPTATRDTPQVDGSPAPQAASPRFRIQAKSIFLTYPQCTRSKEEVHQLIWEHYGSQLEFSIVAREMHKSGDPHLHAVLAFKEKQTFCGEACFDFLANMHGNYQAARNLRQVVRYVTKSGDFIERGVSVSDFLEAATAKKSTKATIMALKIREGATMRQLDELDPGFVLTKKKYIESYVSMVEVWREKPVEPWTPIALRELRDVLVAQGVPSTDLLRLAGWLNKNLGMPRKLRQKQLLLSSPPGFGKTTMKEMLRVHFSVYDHMGGTWFDGFDPATHDIIVFEEFHGLPLSMMNRVLDGQHCLLEVKGSSVRKTKNIPVIILTNLEEHELFVGEKVRQAVREAFFQRVEYIRLDAGEEVWRIPRFSADDEYEDSEVDELEELLAETEATQVVVDSSEEVPAPSSDEPSLALFASDGSLQFDSSAYYNL